MEELDDRESIETIEPYSSDVFDAVWCPICGCDSFHEIRFDGVYCDECNAEVKITPTAGDAGFVTHFMTEYGFNEEYDERRPPDNYVYGKFLLGDSTPYLAWWATRDLDSSWKEIEEKKSVNQKENIASNQSV